VSSYSITRADLSREVLVDHGDGTGTLAYYAPDGTVTSAETVTGLEVFAYGPLDAAGALATLLVVLDLVPISDAANAIHEEPAHLVAEAEAWSLVP